MLGSEYFMVYRGKGGSGMGKLAGLLLVVGGLNWGLAGLGMLLGMNLNVVNLLLGGMPMLEAIIYLVVGISTVVVLMGGKKSMEAGM